MYLTLSLIGDPAVLLCVVAELLGGHGPETHRAEQHLVSRFVALG
jgi:hypothetical protein